MARLVKRDGCEDRIVEKKKQYTKNEAGAERVFRKDNRVKATVVKPVRRVVVNHFGWASLAVIDANYFCAPGRNYMGENFGSS